MNEAPFLGEAGRGRRGGRRQEIARPRILLAQEVVERFRPHGRSRGKRGMNPRRGRTAVHRSFRATASGREHHKKFVRQIRPEIAVVRRRRSTASALARRQHPHEGLDKARFVAHRAAHYRRHRAFTTGHRETDRGRKPRGWVSAMPARPPPETPTAIMLCVVTSVPPRSPHADRPRAVFRRAQIGGDLATAMAFGSSSGEP